MNNADWGKYYILTKQKDLVTKNRKKIDLTFIWEKLKKKEKQKGSKKQRENQKI